MSACMYVYMHVCMYVRMLHTCTCTLPGQLGLRGTLPLARPLPLRVENKGEAWAGKLKYFPERS